MNNTNAGTQQAIVLWLSGVEFRDIRALPEIEALLKQGAMVELEPSPITEPLLQHYQTLSGRLPEHFGFFDTLVPRNYAVVEESSGRGVTPKLLPDLLRTVGWTVRYEEVSLADLAASVQAWTTAIPASPACLIVKCTVRRRVEGSDIAQALRLAQASVGQNGLLALLSDTHPVIVKRFVNVNNFLAEMGVIERDEQNGQVDWRGSVAYHAGHGQLWVNLLGRDAQGAVHPQGEYEEVRETLIKALPAKLRDAGTGEPVIERVYRKEELYAGEYLFCAPDLVIVFKPGYAPSPKSTHIEFDDATFTTPAAGTAVMAGVHPSALGGFLLASAPVLLRGVVAPERAPLTAVTPTLLHAAGVEYVDVDSPAVSALFSPAYLESHPIRSASHNQELSEEDEELIISHLRDLGYV
jgi:hypothetical protein